MPKVSVLVAVYNAEKYLRACLDSLLNQSLKDIEIVCVDDASTDNSLTLLNEYAARDGRLKVATLAKNSGISHTRNVALGMSTGEYVCMVDSDDWLSTDALQLSAHVLDNEQEVDCVLFDFIIAERDDVQGTYTRLRQYKSLPFNRISGLRACELSLDWRIHGLYMIRRAIHLQYPYDESSPVYSDENTTRVHYWASREVAQCAGKYFYRQHAESATHAPNLNKYYRLDAYKSLKQFFQAHADTHFLCSRFEEMRWLTVIDLYFEYYKTRRQLSRADRKAVIKRLKGAWQDIDLSLLSGKEMRKFGYMPLRFSWLAFRMQAELYFLVRAMRDRLRQGKK
jgi:group 2 glycosyl transferase